MNKLLFWIVVVSLAIAGYRFWQLLERKSAARGRDSKAGAGSGGQGRELILACHHCGVYVPSSDVVMHGGHAFCSTEHRDAGSVATDQGVGR